MANSLKQARVVDPVLTTVVQGYALPELIGMQVLPVVLVDKEGGKILQFGKEAFQDYNTARAPRARVQRAEFGTGNIDFQLEEHSIELATDRRETEETRDLVRADMVAARNAQRIILLKHERLAATLLTTAATYVAGNSETPAAGSKWSAATSDPIAAIEAAKEKVRGQIGIYPNTLVIGPQVYKALKVHASLLERIKYSERGVLTAELIGQILDIDRVIVGKAVGADDAGNFTDLWGKHAFLAYVTPESDPNEGTPSLGFTFRKRGRPNAGTYFDPSVKSDVAQVEDIFQCKVLAPGAGYLWRNVVA